MKYPVSFVSPISAPPRPAVMGTGSTASTKLTTCRRSSITATSVAGPLPIFLPRPQVTNSIGTAAVTTVLLWTIFHMPLKTKVSLTQARTNRQTLATLYTIINVVFTLAGGLCWLHLLQSGVWSRSSSALARGTGHFAMGAFGSTQAGYSLWSILVDPQDAQPHRWKWSEESTLMFVHHLSTIFTGLLVATGTCGFRVYAPFFYGLAEISSIPLSLRKVLARGHQYGYNACKAAFVLTFLVARVLLWSFFATALFVDMCQVMAMRGPLGMAILVPLLGTVPLWILTGLQFHWAVMIVKEISKQRRTPSGQPNDKSINNNKAPEPSP